MPPPPDAPASPGGSSSLSSLRIEKAPAAVFARKRRRKWPWIILILLLLIGGLWFSGVLTPAVPVTPATASLVYPAQTFTVLNASGYVVAQRKAAVAAKITSQLVELAVEEGSRVTRGQVLGRLEGMDVAAGVVRAEALVAAATRQIAAAERREAETRAQLVEAELTYRRYTKLVAADVAAQSDLDAAESGFKSLTAELAARAAETRAAESQLDAANAALDEARVNLSYTEITAPFDAVVLTKDADVGDIVTPLGAAAGSKASVVTIADMSTLMVEADVSESNIAGVKPAQPCVVQLDALPGERFPGKVHMIVPTADRAKASIMVKVAFDTLDARILPEMSAKVAFLSREPNEAERAPLLCVPAAAVVREDDAAFVFRIVDGRAARTPVTTGQTLGDLIEIASGLTAGAQVVVSPPKGLADGQPVNPREG